MLLNKNNLDKYLHALALEYRKAKLHNQVLEIILVGGGAIISNYHFRLSTNDADGTGILIKDAVKKVANKYNLPEDWLNDDFIKTKSYSPKIALYSKPYKLFANVLSVRVITREYLIAMKLKSFRRYKNDLSDIIGILIEEDNKKVVSLDEIKKAINDLYGSYEQSISKQAKQFIEIATSKSLRELKKIYQSTINEEKDKYDKLLQIEKSDSNVLNENNVAKAIDKIEKHKSIKDIIKELNDIQNKK